MTATRSTIDQVLDLLVYAPIGLALTASEELPKLAEKGREQLAQQAPTARAVGQLAVKEGQRRVERMAKLAAGRLADMGVVTSSEAADSPAPAAAPTDGPEKVFQPDAGSETPTPASELAIPGYDSLSASQVVQRLDGLSADELEAVRAYESSTRRRKTILTRISQLQGS